MPYFVNNIYKLKATEVAFFCYHGKAEKYRRGNSSKHNFTRSAAFVIRRGGVAILIWAVRWWWYGLETLDTPNTTGGGEIGTGSDTGAIFIGGMR